MARKPRGSDPADPQGVAVEPVLEKFPERSPSRNQEVSLDEVGRGGKAHRVNIGDNTLYFSYETLIGFLGAGERGEYGRLDNFWGPTTGRHFGELGIKHWPIVDGDKLQEWLGAGSVKLRSPTGRSTPAHALDIGEHSLYFSYQTLIGYEGPLGNYRRENEWGPTTGKHFKEMGLETNTVLTAEELQQLVAEGVIPQLGKLA